MKEQELKKTLSEINAKDDLKQQLIENCEAAGNTTNSQKKNKNPRKFTKVAVVAASLAVVILTTTVYGDTIYHKVREIVLGDHSLYISTSVQTDEDNTIEHISAQIVGEIFDEDLAGSHEMSVETFSTLAEAQEKLSFDLNISDYLLENYDLSSIELYTIGDIQSLDVSFMKDGVPLHLLASPVGARAHVAPDIESEITNVNVQGNEGTVSAYNLLFELDGVQYAFSPASGEGLDSLDELTKIADSYK